MQLHKGSGARFPRPLHVVVKAEAPAIWSGVLGRLVVLARPQVEIAVRVRLHLAAAREDPRVLDVLAVQFVAQQEVQVSEAEVPQPVVGGSGSPSISAIQRAVSDTDSAT